MARTTPHVDNGVLAYQVGTQMETLQVGSAAWQRWLDDARTTTFRVVHRWGAFTARKEQRQGGGAYWYAYRKQGGRLRKGYLGRPEDLTLQRLDAVATYLAGEPMATMQEPTQTDAAERPALAPSAAPGAGLPRDALLMTKLHRPPARSDLVERPRLTARLSAGLRGPLTLIVAPAGSGKTTLLSAWYAAQATTQPIAWLALDAGDNDPARFLRYVVAALQTVHAGIGRGVLASLRSPQPPVEGLLTSLLNDLTAQPDDVVLVLDDYHLMTDPAIHRALAFLLDHLPPRLHLVIATRADPPLPLPHLRARGQLTELRAADLRFSVDEAAAFLDHTMGLPLSADDVAALEARTEGWIAGLQLAALSLRGREPALLSAAITALSGTHRYILDYLADQVFDRQPDEVRRFLLHTSVLDRLTGALCDALVDETGEASASGAGQAMLERLDAANLFLVPLDDTRTWYRYHHLFADFLRERLRWDDPERLRALHRRACRWYERQGLPAEAVDHALAAADHAQAADLIEQAGTASLWQRGETATLLRWLERLPLDVARARPRLCLDLAWVLLWRDQVDAAERQLQDAERALDALDLAASSTDSGPDASSRALRGEIATLRAELVRQRGELAAAIDLARRALEDLPAADRWLRGVTMGCLAAAYLWSGQAAAASQAFAETVALGQTEDTIILALFASGRLVQAQALQGRLHQAATTYQQTLDLAGAYGLAAPPVIGVAKVAMADVLRAWNALDAAEDLVRQGTAQCVEAGVLAELALEGCLTLARILQARGDSEGALAALEQAERLGRHGHIAPSAGRVAAARARLWLTSPAGDIAAAVRWANEREEAWRTDEPPSYAGMLERLTLARLRLVQGRRDDAATLLTRLLGRAEAGGLLGCAIEILALHARLLHEKGQEAPAMIALSRALALAEPEGYVRLFVDEGPPMIGLLRQAQARGVAPAYVAALLSACGSAPPSPSPLAAALVEPLTVRELEALRLLAAGLSTPEIAAQLYVTVGTVRSHLKSISRKLDVHSRLQAVERARALGLL